MDEFQFQLAWVEKTFFSSSLLQANCIRQLALGRRKKSSATAEIASKCMQKKINRETIESNFQREKAKKMCNRAIKRCFASARVKEKHNNNHNINFPSVESRSVSKRSSTWVRLRKLIAFFRIGWHSRCLEIVGQSTKTCDSWPAKDGYVSPTARWGQLGIEAFFSVRFHTVSRSVELFSLTECYSFSSCSPEGRS